MRDLAYGLRLIRRKPLLPLLAVLTMAVGIGGSTAIFAIVNATLLRPMMVSKIERLVRIDDAVVTAGGVSDDTNMAPAFAEALRQRQTAFAAIAIQQAAFFTWTGAGEPERLRGSAVSEGWTETLGIAPVLGRFFTAEELRQGPASGQALISHSLWQRRFAARSDVLGQTLTLNGEPRTVVGVMPRGFRFPYEAEIWVPIRYQPDDAANHYLLTFARLRDGVLLEAAQAELSAISEDLGRSAAAGDTRFRMVATPLRENLIRGFDRSATLLLAVAGSLWLLSCVNVAALAVARLAARQGELAVRTALGASRSRQVRQLAVEMCLLVLLGGAAGLGVATLATPWLGVLVPPVMSIELAQNELAVDARVMLFSVAITLLAAIGAAVVPALRASRIDLQSQLKDAGRSGQGRAARRFGSGLVVAEIATAMAMLSVAAGILLSYQRAYGGAKGYEPNGVLSFAVSLSDRAYPDLTRRHEFARRALEEIAAAPGVVSVGAGTVNPQRDTGYDALVPASGPLASTAVGAVGSPPPPIAHVGYVSPGAAAALDFELLEGRWIEARDGADRPLVAVVTDDVARRLWPGRSALGESFRVTVDPNAPPVAVVGVIRRVRQAALPEGSVFLALAQAQGGFYPRELEFLVRGEGDPLGVLPQVRAAIATVDPQVALFRVARLAEVRSPEFVLERAGAVLGAAFSGFGMSLAAIGVLGLLANAMQSRVREFALRKAVGATSRDIGFRILLQALKLTAIGIVCGLMLDLLIGGLLRRLVPAAASLDALHYLALSTLMLLLGLASAWSPARSAARADAATLLRSS